MDIGESQIELKDGHRYCVLIARDVLRESQIELKEEHGGQQPPHQSRL